MTTDFQDIATAPMDGTPIETWVIQAIRFEPYRNPKSGYNRSPGATGRWQWLVGNTWHNMPCAPLCWRPVNPQDGGE